MLPIRLRAAHGGKEHADDLDEAVQHDHVRRAQDVRLAEGEDDDGDVEEDREDEVEDRDPEQSLQASCVRTCQKVLQSANARRFVCAMLTAPGSEDAGDPSLPSERLGLVQPE